VVLPVVIGVVAAGAIGYTVYRFFRQESDSGSQGQQDDGSAPAGGASGARAERTGRAKPDRPSGQAAKPPRGRRHGVPPISDAMPPWPVENWPSPDGIDEKRPLGPHYSAGFLTVWVVDPGWDGTGIPLRDDRDYAAGLSANGAKEPFAVWEKDGVANRRVASFKCVGIDGDRMAVAAA